MDMSASFCYFFANLRIDRVHHIFLISYQQVILKQVGDCIIRRCEPGDLIPVMEINMKILPEHYSDYFYESLLVELPEAFLVAEISGKHVGYIMCKPEYGFSNFKKLDREIR